MNRNTLFSRSIDVAAIPAAGATETLAATEAERQAIAQAFGLTAVAVLSADLQIRRASAGLITVEGRVSAEIVQTCVVSLEPVGQSIEEPVEARYTTVAGPEPARSGTEAPIDIGAEPPEAIGGSTIDLGALVLEHFSLAIDPYPRAPGAELPVGLEDDTRESPFAVLARLRDGEK